MSGGWMARAWPVAVVVCTVTVGCAANGDSPVAGAGAAGTGVAGMAGAAGMGGEPARCVANETQACTCVSGMPGRSLCSSAAVWSLCDCGEGTAGSGGGPNNDPSLNPPGNSRTDLMWTWQETVADNCEPGRYEGTFMCTYVGMGQDPSMGILVTGPIVMTLAESENGEFLEITDGRLDGNTYGIINFTSALSGRLNCATKEFGARAEMGLWGPFIPVNPFDGVLDARYDDVTSTLSGNWALNEMLTMGICSGPWTARRVGP